MMKKYLAIVAFLIIHSVCAQNSFDSSKLSFNIQPLYLTINGLKADFEYSLNSKIHIFVGGQYYTGLVNQGGGKSKENSIGSTADQSKRNNDEINGKGFNVGVKYYFETETDNHLFIGGELQYNRFDFALNDYGYFSFIDDGITFYEYRIGKFDANCTQATGSLYLGQTFTVGKFTLNGWIGSSYTNTEASTNLNNLRNYDKLFWDYSFKGFSPLLGFKLGYFLF
jgi:hypothetical protein